MNCRAAPLICENLGTWQAKATYIHTLIESLPNLNNSNSYCEYLNGYVTVQHRSFGNLSLLDPRSSIIETQDSVLASRDSILASQNSKRSSFETRGSSLELRVSTYFWAVLHILQIYISLISAVHMDIYAYLKATLLLYCFCFAFLLVFCINLKTISK